ncbi:hypothetical protein J7S19_01635 [Corynebacterium pyruviciproducens]|uniref:hypothetical protein n=1 Tax=Corynebacterium pyruviciproducens TaxID=598660 RepID=UPI0024561832|nr:hypothetical protein [Corynebacterium pyruviciproducens]MDH4657330.1 hypothetical protein [Corynebacterium pyruviciproducens]
MIGRVIELGDDWKLHILGLSHGDAFLRLIRTPAGIKNRTWVELDRMGTKVARRIADECDDLIKAHEMDSYHEVVLKETEQREFLVTLTTDDDLGFIIDVDVDPVLIRIVIPSEGTIREIQQVLRDVAEELA